MPRPPKTDWSLVDWTKTDTEISNATGVCPSRVGRARKEQAPHTFSEGRRGRPADGTAIEWITVDLSRPTAELAEELGVSRTSVRFQKAKRNKRPERTEAEWCSHRIGLRRGLINKIMSGEIPAPCPLSKVEYAIYNMASMLDELGQLVLTATKQQS